MPQPRKHYVTAGQVFGRLVVEDPETLMGRRRAATCVCVCGVRRDFLLQNLVNGVTRSCGCLNRELHVKREVEAAGSKTVAARRAAGVCTACGQAFPATFMKNGKPHARCEECRTKSAVQMKVHRDSKGESYRSYQREFNRRRRQQVYDYYGGKCECCGEQEFAFLSIDHKNGGGTRHRAELRTRGNGIIGWIIANGYPDEFRVLCHNCNQAIGFYGACPHKEER